MIDDPRFKQIYDVALERIADSYKEGVKESLDRQAPSLSRRIKDLEKEIDRTWYHDLEKFTRAVAEWESLWLQACQLVNNT